MEAVSNQANHSQTKVVIGVDPGLDGGIAVLHGASVNAHVMPVLKNPSGRGRVIDTQRVVENIEMASTAQSAPTHVFIEAQQARPGQGVKSMLRLGKGVGILEGVCAALRVPFEFVTARQWQKVIFAGLAHRDTKAAAILKARQLYPNVSLLATSRCSRPHDGMADALMIATFGKRVLAGEGMAARSGGSPV